jgi:hypothetical protein
VAKRYLKPGIFLTPKFIIMKTRIIPVQLLSILLVWSLFIISCAKEKSGSGADQQEMEISKVSSESDGEAELIFNSLFDDAMGVNDEVGMAGTGVFGINTPLGSTGGNEGTQRPNSCFTVTVTHPQGTPFPVHVVIDFGTTGCPGPGGHIRTGKIIIDYTNRLIIPGAVATTTFDQFYIDSVNVTGTHRIENTTLPGTVARRFTVDVIHGKLLKPNGNYTEWDSHKVITQIDGISTPTVHLDDVFKIEGAAHGKVKRGTLIVVWQSTITDPLIKRFNCRWIVRGRIRTVRATTTTTSPWVAILDFGQGDCDNLAVIIINGVPHNITLH